MHCRAIDIIFESLNKLGVHKKLIKLSASLFTN